MTHEVDPIASPSVDTPPSTSDDRRARKNAFLLAGAQSLAGANVTVTAILGGIVGAYLAEDKTLSTLPITLLITGAAVTTIPASNLMRRIGRRAGFMSAALVGMAGAAVVAYAIWIESFALVCFGSFLLGVYNAFVQYFRFAAADTASPAFRPKAISWVLAGGVIAAVIGPQIVIWGKDLLAPIQFAGAYVVLIGTCAVTFCILNFIDVPLPKTETHSEPARPLGEILRQRRLVIAILCGMASFSMMTLAMTATPLAMLANHHGVDDAAFVIQWHAVAMFAPSFITGSLIARFGVENIVIVGLILITGCGAASLLGVEIHHFWLAMVLLGIGWNFSFVGATAMVAECYRSSERNKVQGINDFAVFSTVAMASFMSGALFQHYGWLTLIAVLICVSVLALALVSFWRFNHLRSTAH